MLLATLVGLALAWAFALPLAWKWQLGVRRVAISVAVLAAVAGLVLTPIAGSFPGGVAVRAAAVAVLAVLAAVALLAWRFYRDPERQPPAGNGLIISPADGEVCYVRRSEHGLLPVSTKHGHDYPLTELTRTSLDSEDAIVIGIAMSFLDVHVNRAPIAGEVTLRRHFPGQFGSLRRPEMAFINERATTVINGDGIQVAMVQIASRLVRQIAGFVREGERVTSGQRVGVIRLGSQVDLVLPLRPDIDIRVAPGQRVRAGETVIAGYRFAPVPARQALEVAP